MKRIASLILATSALTLAEVKITLQDIADNRRTSRIFGSTLDIKLKASGPELKNCKGIRIVVKEVKDNMGQVIKQKEDGFHKGEFEIPQHAFGGFGDEKKEDEYELKIELENPARSAKTITLNAAMEMLIPSMDPKAVVTADVAKSVGKALADEGLKAADVTITLKAPTASDVSYTLSDPKKKVAFVEFCAPDGMPLKTNGWNSSSFSFSEKKDVTVSLDEKAPARMLAKIYLLTDKSIVKTPVSLPDIALP